MWNRATKHPLSFDQRALAEISAVDLEDAERNEARIAAVEREIVEARSPVTVEAHELAVEHGRAPELASDRRCEAAETRHGVPGARDELAAGIVVLTPTLSH